MTDDDPDALIDRLTTEHLVEVTDADGITTAVRRPPLLRDLTAARVASIGVGRGGAQQAHQRTGLDFEASQLLTAIEHRVRTWAIAAGIRPTGTAWPPVERVLAAWHTASDDVDPARIRKLAGWVQAIEDLLDPPHRYPLPDPCPLCGVAYVDTAEQHGPALQVTARRPAARSTVVCRACEHVWPGVDGARTLARQIRGDEAAS